MTDVEVITPIVAVNIHRVKYGEIKEIFNKLHYDNFLFEFGFVFLTFYSLFTILL